MSDEAELFPLHTDLVRPISHVSCILSISNSSTGSTKAARLARLYCKQMQTCGDSPTSRAQANRSARGLDRPSISSYSVVHMAGVFLGEFEQVVLLAILRLGDKAYGVSIREEIGVCTDREPSPGALYTTLDRLQERGFVTSRFGDPTPERGGRSKRYFQVSPKGVESVARVQRGYKRLLNGIHLPGMSHA